MSYRDVRQETADQSAMDRANDPFPCLYCGEQTTRATRTLYGARCRACYDQFLRLGYSGDRPSLQCRQSPAVAESAERARQRWHLNPMFDRLADRVHQRIRQREDRKREDGR